MTIGVELPPPETRRNRWGQYLIVPPQGGKPVGYVRATTVAKSLDNGGGIADWKATMCATGIIMRRGLRSQWEALLAEHNGNPWYASEAGKAACKRLVEECAAAGGADDRKDTGSALHTITALADSGRAAAHLTSETETDINAYRHGLAAAGITVVDGMVEQTIVLDRFQVAGTFDRLVTVPGYQLPLVADLKTGANLAYSWQPIAVQLACYSRADFVYRQGANPDGSKDERLPMPYVNKQHGLVAHLNAGRLELHLVDLDAGWEAFGHSMWARRWRGRQVAAPYQPPQEDLVPALQASLDAVQTKTGQDTPTVREWLQDRIHTIGRHPAARADLAAAWPAELPTLRATTTHTPAQLNTIDDLLAEVERRQELPFPPPKPTKHIKGETDAR